MTPTRMLQDLERWRAAGCLRSLDLALARFIADTDPQAPASLLLAAALLAQLEGRGHCALPIAELLADPQGLLAWPSPAVEGLRSALATWPSEPGACVARWRGAASIEIEPADDTGSSPLVASGGLLYLRRYWRHEIRVAGQVRARAADRSADIDPAAAQVLLDRLFAPLPAEEGPDWQKIACETALRARLTLITGGPGTGKTHTAARLLVLLQALRTGPSPLRVALAAPTGKAAARLRQSIDKALGGLEPSLAASVQLTEWVGALGPARTLHSLLGAQPGTRRFRHDAANPLDLDLLIVDEASMIHLEMMALLLDALPSQARVVLLGDRDQLASVEAGAVMGDLCHGAGEGGGSPLALQTVVLRKSHRFGGPIGTLALAVNAGDARAAQAILHEAGEGPLAIEQAPDARSVSALALHGRPGASGGYQAYLSQLAMRPSGRDPDTFATWVKSVLQAFDAFRVLCAVREGPWGVSGLNESIERSLTDAGLLARRGEWYEGRPVMVTRNDPALGVFNGDIGIVLRGQADDGALRCWFADGEGLRSVSVARLADVETAFAMTVHKSQGSEFAHVVLVLPEADVPVLTRELVYTGITRARAAFTLVARHPDLLGTAIGRLTRRVSGLRQRL
ncbi:MAG: exodeoxyribonuclease V subunit alpha [Burkholderiales bacterium]